MIDTENKMKLCEFTVTVWAPVSWIEDADIHSDIAMVDSEALFEIAMESYTSLVESRNPSLVVEVEK